MTSINNIYCNAITSSINIHIVKLIYKTMNSPLYANNDASLTYTSLESHYDTCMPIDRRLIRVNKKNEH